MLFEMDIGNDISQKIRSAIKAKLVELGAYVDDELPDYIMVMVANKKSKSQMTEDLGLFLGFNTEKFTSWLHDLLNKLQNLSTDKQKHQEIKRTENESKKADSAVAKRKQSSDTPATSTSKTSGKTKNTKVAMTTNAVKDKKDVRKTKEEEYVPELLDKTETDEFSEEFNKEEEGKKIPGKANSAKPQQAKASTCTIKQNPVIETPVKPSSSSSPVTSHTSQSRPLSRPGSVKSRLGAPVPKAVASPMKRTASSHQDRQVSPPKKKKPMSVIGNVSKFTKEFEEEDEEYDPCNPAVGSVASVIKVTDRKSSVPLSLQAKPSLLMKAVTAAEKSVSATLQQVLQQEKMYSAKVKPVRPVQHSSYSKESSYRQKRERETKQPTQVLPQQRVHERRQPVQPLTVTLTAKLKDKSGIQLTSKSRREELLRNMTYTIQNDVEKPRKQPEVARVPPVMDSRLVQCVQKEDTVHTEEEEEAEMQDDVQEEVMEEEEDQELLQKAAEVLHSGSEMMDSPTAEDVQEEDNMSEVVEEVIEEKVEEEDVEEKIDEAPVESVDEEEIVTAELLNETDPEIQQVLSKDNDLDLEEQGDTVEIKQMPKPHSSFVSDSRRFIQERVKPPPVAKVNPKFIVTLDGVDADRYEGCYVQQKGKQQPVVCQEEAPPSVVQVSPKEAVVQVKMPEIKPISISLKDTSDEEDYEEEEESPLTQAKMKERCKFWPACVNGNSCPFHHPTIPCKMFPHCKFRDKCLYIHPNCKFDAKCTRTDCPFTHASKRGPVTTVIQKIVQIPLASNPVPVQSYIPNKSSSTTTCRFYPNCKNMSCPFVHPTPCRFGMACTRKATCTFYHPPLPEKDKLKWTAEKHKEHISDRKFDKSGPLKKMPASVT